MRYLSYSGLADRRKSLLSAQQKGIIISALFVVFSLCGLAGSFTRTNADPVFRPILNRQAVAASAIPLRHIRQIRQIQIGQSFYTPPAPEDKPVGSLGTATQVRPGTWTVSVRRDPYNAGPGEIFTALNAYRKEYGAGSLNWDNGLSSFAQSRADYYTANGKLDSHQGFLSFLNNQNGFQKLGYSSLGENASLGFTLSGAHLIGLVYASDAEHNANQLNSQWTSVGIGVSGTATDLVFGGGRTE